MKAERRKYRKYMTVSLFGFGQAYLNFSAKGEGEWLNRKQ
jgi:hypothetical protein